MSYYTYYTYYTYCVCHTTHVCTDEGCHGGKTEVVVELVKAEANVDIQDNVCQYVLHLQCTNYILTMTLRAAF